MVNASLSEPMSIPIRVGFSLDASELSEGEREVGGASLDLGWGWGS